MGLLGRSWGSWGALGPSWGALGRSWSSWGALGARLGALGALLGLSWGALGTLLGPLGALLGALGTLLGVSWAQLGKNTQKNHFFCLQLGRQNEAKLEPKSSQNQRMKNDTISETIFHLF